MPELFKSEIIFSEFESADDIQVLRAGEHSLAMFLLSDDPDRPGKKELNLRLRADLVDVLKQGSPIGKRELLHHMQLLLDNFKAMVNPQ
jgi:hypothetical protein